MFAYIPLHSTGTKSWLLAEMVLQAYLKCWLVFLDLVERGILRLI